MITNKRLILLIIVLALIAITVEILWEKKTVADVVELKIEETDLQHRRETWLSALEWCESHGVKTAINKMDKDGTPSFFSFQFKPSTFKYYSVKYKLLSPDLEYEDYFNWMSDYDMTREVVRRMIDDPKVQWNMEFPDCVKRLGYPPIK